MTARPGSPPRSSAAAVAVVKLADEGSPLPPMHEPVRLPLVAPRFLVRLALGLHRWLTRLVDALTPAPLALAHHAFGAARSAALGTAARLGIADLLADGPLDAAEIARRIGGEADVTARLLRALASFGIFRRLPDGR